jgi:glutamine amidotransferase
MQLICAHSDERGGADGLGWIDGRWVKLHGGRGCPVPHVGWNEVRVTKESPLFMGLPPSIHYYFDHSYRYVGDNTDVIAELDYAGETVVAALHRGNIVAVQFHPERSQQAGTKLFANFLTTINQAELV